MPSWVLPTGRGKGEGNILDEKVIIVCKVLTEFGPIGKYSKL